MAIFVIIAVPCLFLIQTYLYSVPLSGKTYYYKESDYYTIKLSKTMSSDKETELEAMVLDNLIHSYVNLKDPRHIEYEYERIYADVLKWKFDPEIPFKSLTIGGGGYTFPRYIEITYPKAKIDVVEIDPHVTKVVYDHLGLPKDTRIVTYNTDGRWYVMNCTEKYDLVFTDAYNDISIPYHLTTKEFLQQIKDPAPRRPEAPGLSALRPPGARP